MPSMFQRSLQIPRFWQLALACYWLALFIGTHVPIERLALNRGTGDKFAHVAAFAGLALLAASTWRVTSGQRLQPRHLLSVWVLVMLYGAIEETTQPFAMRTASIHDWIADAIGATIGLLAFWSLRRRFDASAPASPLAERSQQARSWRRYSLRVLFLVMTLVAVACYWLMLPTMNAQKFMRAIHVGDYATAKGLFMSGSEEVPGAFRTIESYEPESKISPLTWSDLWAGERRVFVTVRYGNHEDEHRGGATIFAYRKGLALHPLVLPFSKPPGAAQ